MQRYLALLPLLALTVSCSPFRSSAPAAAPEESLTELQKIMTGSFNSSRQASTDDSYYNIVLHMEPIWTDRPGNYLYVEQALAATPQEPYRQRVYKLERKGRKKLISRVFELPTPDKFIGAHEDPDRLRLITPADLTERKGCAVYLKMESPGLYRGSTRKNKCKSSLSGASYATSRVSISRTFVQSWDRGFDADGKQVWGATEGGYLFFRE